MDLYRLSSDLKFINQIGTTLSIEERLKLDLALQKLADSYKFDQLLFWGRIEGISKDYFIAIGLNFKGQFEFPVKSFFWSSNNFIFAELPDINREMLSEVDNFRQLFTGQHDKVLIAVAEQEVEEQQQEDVEGQENKANISNDEIQIKIPQKVFTELDRLVYVVRSIENDCSLIPVGAFRLTATHELRYNDTFEGLSLTQANKLQNYQHFSAPKSQEKKDLISKDETLFSYDFFDPIQDDVPRGSWSIQTDSSKTKVTIRSLLWPGFVGYHKSSSRIFGYAYFGNGIKNCDLPFLIDN